MKNKIALLFMFVCVLFTHQVLAQNEETIKIDFLKPGQELKDRNLEYKTKYILKIENINRNLYKVESAITSENVNATMPDIFKGIKLPGYLNLAVPKISSTTGPLAASPISRSNYKTTIEGHLKTINESNATFKKTAVLNNDFINLFNTCNTEYKIIEQNLIDKVNTYLGSKVTDRATQSDKIKSTLENVINSSETARDQLDLVVPKYTYEIDKEIKSNTKVILKWEKEPVNKKDAKYDRSLIAYEKAKDENESYTKLKDSINAVIVKTNESVATMIKFRDENKINELVNNYNIINESNFTFTSEPILVKTDETKFDIKITSDKLLPCNLTDKVHILETLKTKGGWKIDFSTGIFFNGGNDDFMGRELQYQPITDSTVTIKNKDGGDRILLSLGALMHIYRRTGKSVNYALSPGLSTTTAFDGVNFHLGASVLLGYKNRLVITGGLVLREAKILDKNYNYNTEYLKKEIPESPPTIKVFPKAGWFFSLTYNFSEFKS
ncbi:hypothetical protein [Flavobacterium sp.]|uniref:hypothetical protein n=1 Tax=Flavobacterium sp. TaxID=239 RepID=UPI00374CE541